MTSGWIKLHRKILEWGWWSDINTAHVFLTLLLMASHKPSMWHGVKIERGQVITGREKLAKMLGMGAQSIRTCLTRLKSTSEITIKSTNRFSIITILNYDKYQIVEESANQQINQPANQQLTNSQPATNHIQECKKDKNNKNEEERESLSPLKRKPKEKTLPLTDMSQLDLPKLKGKGLGDSEITYLFEQIQSAQDGTGRKHLHSNYTRTILNWREMRLQQGLIWNEEEKGYRKKPWVDPEKKPSNKMTAEEMRAFMEGV